MSENPAELPVEIKERGLDELIAKLEQADDLLLKIREDAVKAFNVSTGQKYAPGTGFEAMTFAASKFSPGQYGATYGPDFAQAMAAEAQRRQAIAASAQTFAASPSFPASAPLAQQVAAFQQYANIQPQPLAQTPTPPSASQRPVPITASQDFMQSLGRALSIYSRPAQVAAINAGSRLLGPLGGVGWPLANAAGEGIMAGGLAAGIGVAGLGLGVGVAGGLAANAMQATYYRRQALLQASEFGAPGTGQQNVVDQNAAAAVAQGFNYHQDQANKTAVQLAMAGVTQQQLLGGLSSTFAMGRATGLGPDEIAPLTSALMVQGGQTQQQVAKTFQAMINGAQDQHIAVTRLVQDMKDLTRETGNASVNIAGLTAVQSIVGPAINAGQIMAPALGATGTGALGAAAVLGVSPAQFMAMQGQPGAMWDAISRMSKRYGGGATGQLITEQVLQQTGLMDFTGVGPQQVARIVSLLQSGKAGQAEALSKSISRQTSGQSTDEVTWLRNVANATTNQTSATERLIIVLQNWLTQQVTGGPNPPAPPVGQSGHYQQIPTRTGTRWQWVPNPPPTGPTGLPALKAGQSYAYPNYHGGVSRFPTSVVNALYATSQQTGVPFEILMAQAAAEGTNPATGMVDPGSPGGGLGQFTKGTIANLAHNVNDNALVPGLNRFFQSFNPQDTSAKGIQRQAQAMGLYDELLYKLNNGNWQGALNQYNSGNPNYGYGPQITVELTGKVDLMDSSGKVIGQFDLSQAKTAVKNPPQTNRPAKGATTHGPPPGLHRH